MKRKNIRAEKKLYQDAKQREDSPASSFTDSAEYFWASETGGNDNDFPQYQEQFSLYQTEVYPQEAAQSLRTGRTNAEHEQFLEKIASAAPQLQTHMPEKTIKSKKRSSFFPLHLGGFTRRASQKKHHKTNKAKIAAAGRSEVAYNPFIVFGNFIFMLAAFLIIIGTLLFYSIKRLYEQPNNIETAQTVTIPAGAGVNAVAALLEKQGLINSSYVFTYGIYLAKQNKALKAGEYEIPAHASAADIANILTNGHGLEYSVTVAEGLTVAQVFAKIAENPLFVGNLPEELPAEGTLMANTINFPRGTQRSDIVKRLHDEQMLLVRDIWEQRDPDLLLKSSEEMVILASIVEKETGIASERPHIASVFYNRLKKNMRLQSDPTIIYGIFGGLGKPADRAIYRSDLERETSYNTYKIFGLPPTPICNPGRDSLMAVAHPAQTEDLYFVADGTGGHIFSKTLEEHNGNVSKWRNFKKTQQANSASTEDPLMPKAEDVLKNNAGSEQKLPAKAISGKNDGKKKAALLKAAERKTRDKNAMQNGILLQETL